MGSLPHLQPPMATPNRRPTPKPPRHRDTSTTNTSDSSSASSVRPLPALPPARTHAHGPVLEPALEPDRELLRFNVRLAKQRQGLLDTNRIERKAFREHARVENAVGAYVRELATQLERQPFSTPPRRRGHQASAEAAGEAVLIVQLSDLHFNERVDLPSNRYDFTIASARLAKLAQRVKQLGRCYGARKAVIACLGDFLNSDRRLDELLSNVTNRSRATLLAADILRAFLLDLRSCFQLEVYGITGNESRVTPELGWSDELATDSYDLMIYAILRRSFSGPAGKGSKGSDGIRFCGFRSHELLFEVMGRTFLCLHGHQIGANVQKSVQEISGRYAARGITVDYTLMGHLHATAIGDYHARNASLVGSNAYAEAGLNYCSKAAQNVHIVTAGAIDGVKVDLQDTDGITPYPFVSEWEAYAPKSESKLHQGAVVFQVVV
jgi:hypothetical protein